MLPGFLKLGPGRQRLGLEAFPRLFPFHVLADRLAHDPVGRAVAHRGQMLDPALQRVIDLQRGRYYAANKPAHRLCYDQGLRGDAGPAQGTGQGLVHPARDQGRGASDRTSIRYRAFSPQRSHGIDQPALRPSCLIHLVPKRQTDANQLFATEPIFAMRTVRSRQRSTP